MQPDATDWKIIQILRQGIQPNSKIAEMLDVSEGMIRRRIQNLKEAGILELKALINPEVLENQQLAVIGVNVAESRILDSKAKEIARLDNVLSVSIASGRYDLLVEILVDSNKGLVKFLTQSLSTIKEITKTESFLLLKNYNKRV